MAQCRHFWKCGKEGSDLVDENFCILHSPNETKDAANFASVLAQHQETRGHDYSFIVFPSDVDFRGKVFETPVVFMGVIFTGSARFGDCTFKENAYFMSDYFNFAELTRGIGRIVFTKDAGFVDARFEKDALFEGAHFKKRALFTNAIFNRQASFTGVHFFAASHFSKASFNEKTSFEGASFEGNANFSWATFRGKTVFSGPSFNLGASLSDLEHRADFRWLNIDEKSAIEFRGVDLSRALFSHTDLTRPEFIDVRWARRRGMNRVFDEHQAWSRRPGRGRSHRIDQADIQWGDLEQLYRALKQNYEDRRDYGRAGDFHYREKQMRKRNPSTIPSDKILLWLYWALSGYSERIWPPVVWLILIVILCSFFYLITGLHPKDGGQTIVWGQKITGNWGGFKEAILYSARTSFFLKPEDLALSSTGAKAINLVQTVLSPILLALLGLAIRQRMQR